MAKIKTSAQEQRIKEALIEQLDATDNLTEWNTELINDYCTIWYSARMAETDIRTRGINVEYTSQTGVTNFKKNESVDMLIKLNLQMVKILQHLGLKPVDDEKEEAFTDVDAGDNSE